MTAVTVKYRFQLAGWNAAEWTAGTLLKERELGLELDTGKAKLGDGVTTWGSLGYHYFWTTWSRIDSKPTTLAGYGITDAQGLDGDLTAIAALTGTNTIYYRSAANTWTAVTIGGNLGFSAGTLGSALGTMATQSASAVAITGGSITGLTGLTLTDSTLPRLALFRSGIGTWYVGNQTAGGTTNTFQITFNTSSAFELTTGLAATFRGTVSIVGHGTTASGANAFIDSTTGLISRSTSSLFYKRDVEDLDPAVADALLALRPIWYRSAIETDRQDWSWLGVAAEELAAIEPRLVHWGYRSDDYDRRFKNRRVLRAHAQLRPLGVAYDRMTVPLLSIVQRLVARVESLEAALAARDD